MAVFSIQGIGLSAYAQTDYEGPNLPNLVLDAKSDGANFVTLSNISEINLQTGAIGDYVVNQPDGSVFDGTAKFSDIGPAIAAAEAQGLQVMLKPQIGAVDPTFGFGNLTDPNEVIADPAAFFASYQAYILQWAELAQQYHVPILSIGNEMLAATKPQYTSYWDTLIAAVRQVYSGELTYSALLPLQTNASAYNEVQQIQFWNQLDFAGFDVYPSLTTKLDPSVAQLNAAWQKNVIGGQSQSYVQSISQLAESVGKPVLFTETGVASFPGANDRYKYNDSFIGLSTTKSDFQNQANWWASFFDTWGANKPSWLAGVSYTTIRRATAGRITPTATTSTASPPRRSCRHGTAARTIWAGRRTRSPAAHSAIRFLSTAMPFRSRPIPRRRKARHFRRNCR